MIEPNDAQDAAPVHPSNVVLLRPTRALRSHISDMGDDAKDIEKVMDRVGLAIPSLAVALQTVLDANRKVPGRRAAKDFNLQMAASDLLKLLVDNQK